MTDKVTLVCDIECYVDYFLVMFWRVGTGHTKHFEMFDGQPLDRKSVSTILHKYRIVTFNGMKYDMPMLALALQGKSCAELKKASDSIIVGNLQPWQFEQLYGIKVLPRVDHIDISEVAPGVLVSLKQYAGRMHMPRLQDLPIDPDSHISPMQRAELRDYCGNSDLPATEALFKEISQQVELRTKLSAESGLELRSKSDAQVAESLIKASVEKIKGERVSRPDIPPGTKFKYTPPDFISFKRADLQKLLSDIVSSDFVVSDSGKISEPEFIKDLLVHIGESSYRMGIGGLHSNESSISHISDENYILLDRDVRAYYPSIVLACNLTPKQMGKAFIDVYRAIVNKRVTAKLRSQQITKRLSEIDKELST